MIMGRTGRWSSQGEGGDSDGVRRRVGERLRAELDSAPSVVEKMMFGGLAFLVNGNMCVGVHGDDLIARVGEQAFPRAVARVGARTFDLTGRPMRGWILVEPAGVADDGALAGWVADALDFVLDLPPK
jgi:hypothetical protein